MELLYISRYGFIKKNDKIYSLPAYSDFFWQKYLGVFDTVHVIGIAMKVTAGTENMSELSDDRVQITILPDNTHPKDFKNDRYVKKELESVIKRAEAVLIKPDSRRGIMAIKLSEKNSIPYMIEMTGDFYSILSRRKSIIMKLYAPIIYKQVLNAIKNCKYGLYVTHSYLQKKYPIKGKMCGCSDVVIPETQQEVLEKRIQRIDKKICGDSYKIGLVGGYHNKNKGIDTAIKALTKVSNENVEFHILGFGIEEDRKRWYDFAKLHGVQDKLFFDGSRSSINDVLTWNDEMDIIILPSRSEGLPRCIVESLSRACPCIISNVSGMPELVSEHWLHNPEDSKKLADLITELLANKDLMKKVAEENFNHSFEYSKSKLDEKRNLFLEDFKNSAVARLEK